MQIGSACRLALLFGLVGVGGCSSSALPRKTVVAPASEVPASTAPAIYVVGGNVTGLRGIGLTLRDARGEALKVRSDGTFVFGTPLADHSTFAVTVDQEPFSPLQSCRVEHGTGRVTGRDALEIDVTCSTISFEVPPEAHDLREHASARSNAGARGRAPDVTPDEMQASR